MMLIEGGLVLRPNDLVAELLDIVIEGETIWCRPARSAARTCSVSMQPTGW
jgi:hypothetical protein